MRGIIEQIWGSMIVVMMGSTYLSLGLAPPNCPTTQRKHQESREPTTNGIKTLRAGTLDGEIKDGKMGVASDPRANAPQHTKKPENLTRA